MNVSFYTLGCKVNQYETEAIKNLFEKNGYNIVETADSADIFIINSCTVTSASDRKTRQMIRRFKRKNNELVMILMGCYSQNHIDDLKNDKIIDIIIGTKEKNKILEITNEYLKKNKKYKNIVEFDKKEKYEDFDIIDWETRTRANIKIQDGCNQYCSYCIIPYVRGPNRSRNRDEIINEIINLSKKNYKEIIINGINLSSLGRDDKEGDLVDLIKEIDKLNIKSRIRLGSLEANIINEEMIKIISKNNNFANHFHISLQSGSDTVLQRMNRNYTTEDYYKKVKMIRRFMPECGITTDIIVGFPGETKKEFGDTYEFIEKVKFSRIHVFKFSAREGTTAYKMKDKINGKLKNERSKKIIELGEELENEFCNKFIGEKLEVLFESKDDSGYYFGYTNNYIQCKYKSDEDITNKILNIKIRDIENNILIG